MPGDGPNEQDLIRELAKLLDETGLGEIEVEREGLRVRVARQTTTHVVASAPGVHASPIAGVAAASATAGEIADPGKHPGVVTSPMVGTAYRSPEPGTRPFVDIGSVVAAGDTLLIVEAMKTMNTIQAPHGGTVKQILFEDGEAVEYGAPLMIVE